MENNDVLRIKDNSAVQAHISMLQGIINRLSDKSANCKSWCVGIISAIFVLFFSTEKININNDLYWMYYTPVLLFLFLNCYYLGQERQFVKKQTDFIDNINNGKFEPKEIYLGKKHIRDNRSIICIFFCKLKDDLLSTIGAFFSFSIIIFYGVSLIITKVVLNNLIIVSS